MGSCSGICCFVLVAIQVRISRVSSHPQRLKTGFDGQSWIWLWLSILVDAFVQATVFWETHTLTHYALYIRVPGAGGNMRALARIGLGGEARYLLDVSGRG